jgi:glycosidase
MNRGGERVSDDPGERLAWWQRGVVYQVYPRSFQDASGDGVGDLRGVIGRLDYLAHTLGVDAVWLSPFYPSPMADFGYDIADFTGVDPLFGDLASFDALVEGAHRRGLKVIVDYVPNHSSDRHPWFVESRSRRDAPKRDWYVWRDPKPDGSPPNNWVANFGGAAWTWDERTGQYYLHSFLPEQPDLNWRNPEVRAAMLDVLRFWLDRGVDGFRIDAAYYVMKDPELRDNPPNPAAGSMHKSMGEYDRWLHLHDKGHPDMHDVFRDIRRLLRSYDGGDLARVAIGEVHVFDPVKWARYFGETLDEFHLPFNFGLLAVRWDAASVRRMVDELEAAVPPGAWPNWVLGNHDEPRIATRLGAGRARLAAMLLLTLRGTPTLYYGDEIGMRDVPIPQEREQDPWGKRVPGLGLGRDPARTPMQWDATPNAGFCPAGVEPWLPVAHDHRQSNVAAQLGDPASMLSLTRRLLALRRSSPALHAGAYRAADGAPEGCFAYWRWTDGQCILVALNLSDGPVALDVRSTAGSVPLAAAGRAVVAASTGHSRAGRLVEETLELDAGEGCVVAFGPT